MRPVPREPEGRQASLVTSASLVDGLKEKQPLAWVRFVRLYGPLIYSWCRRRCLGPDDAADTVQKVFQAVRRRIDSFRREGGGSFRGWLWTITFNKVRDLRKKHSLAPAVGGSDFQQQLNQVPSAPESDDGEPTEPGDRIALVRRAEELIRGEFEPRTCEAFRLSAVEGRHTTHVAEDLGMTEAAVRRAKSRVLRRLREVLAELGEEPPPA